MTVKELIEKLEGYDKNAEVMILEGGFNPGWCIYEEDIANVFSKKDDKGEWIVVIEHFR